MKATLEITANQWTWTVFDNQGQEICSETMARQSSVSFRSTKASAKFERKLERLNMYDLFEGIYDSDLMQIANALSDLEHRDA